MPVLFALAARNLIHDRLRFAATLIGIVFAIVLITVQLGLYLGFERMVTAMIDHASADLWVVAKDSQSFENPSPIETRVGGELRRIGGIESVWPVVVGFAEWRLPGGGVTPVLVVGSDLKAGVLAPWNIVDGSVAALFASRTAAVDKTYFARLGISAIGAKSEIRGEPVRVAAVTDGIRSFTTTPYAFSNLDQARAYIGLPGSKTSHFLVRLRPGAEIDTVQREIDSAIRGVRALTPAQFGNEAKSFWLIGTGAGAALFGGALLGIIVGTVVVAQTLYSSTKDHLYEFATLRAIGCSNRYIYAVIAIQALISAAIGFAVAALVGKAVVALTAATALQIVITPVLTIILFSLTLVMCIISACAAILQILRTDPIVVMAP
jgi:putative ABC transport system permease protein